MILADRRRTTALILRSGRWRWRPFDPFAFLPWGVRVVSRILVVEDEPIIADAVAMLLTDEGYDVRTARSGRAALEALEAVAADLVVSDVMMPELDGLGLVAALRRRGDRTPVLLMSAAAVIADLPAGIRFLRKPFDLDAMLEAVRGALDGPA
jgi:DNA-binding response OmpR family regulator